MVFLLVLFIVLLVMFFSRFNSLLVTLVVLEAIGVIVLFISSLITHYLISGVLFFASFSFIVLRAVSGIVGLVVTIT